MSRKLVFATLSFEREGYIDLINIDSKFDFLVKALATKCERVKKLADFYLSKVSLILDFPLRIIGIAISMFSICISVCIQPSVFL